MVDCFLGQVNTVAFNFAPRGWTLCNGQLLSIAQNTALFSLLGTAFGGDGRVTFGVPALRGRAMVGVGTGPGLSSVSWGERAGYDFKVLTVSEIPSHTHALRARQEAGDTRVPVGSVKAGDNSGDAPYSTDNPNVDMKSTSILNTGSNFGFYTSSPYLGLYNCICLVGQFPSRS